MITYGSTTLTSYNTITKIEVYYYKSTSATDLTGGSWSTTKPTWENGKYIWQKIKTTYEGKLENGQFYSESDPVNITGQQGATGTAAYSYKLNASDSVIGKTKTGEYTIDKITFTATYKQGTGAVTAYTGRFKIETTANGTTWTTQYTSSGNESSKEYTIPEDIISIRCSLYQSGGTSTLLDIVTIPIVKDGIDAVGLRDSIPYYLASDKQTGVTRLDQGWTRFKPELTTEKRYLWAYYVSRYSEGDTQPELIEIKNDIVSFENHGDESPVENCVIDIEPVQDLHGQSSPYPAGGGKNLCSDIASDYTKPTNYWVWHRTLVDGTYYITVTAKSGAETGYAFIVAKSGDAYTEFVDAITVLTTAGATYNRSFIVDSTWINPVIGIYCPNGKTVSDFFANYTVQLEKNATATDYAPYSNICPITSFTGENIWDEEWEVGGYNINTGEKTVNNSFIRCKNPISVVSGQTYHVVCSSNLYAIGKDKDGNCLGLLKSTNNVSALGGRDVTIPTNVVEMCWYSDTYGTTYNNDISINYPASFTGYIPYSWKGGMTAHVTRAGKNLLNPDISAWETSKNYKYFNNVVPKGQIARFTFIDKDTSIDISQAYIGFVYDDLDSIGNNGVRTYRWAMMNGTPAQIPTNIANNGNIGSLCQNVFIYPNTKETFNALFARYYIMVELGSTATDYEPYAGDTYSITFPNEAGTVYGGTLNVTTGVLTVNKTCVDLGSLTIEQQWLNGTAVCTVRAFLPYDGKNNTDDLKTGVTGICDFAKWYPYDISYNGLPSIWNIRKNDDYPVAFSIVNASNEHTKILIKDSQCSTLSEYQEKYNNSNYHVCYELAEPITYTLTPQEITMLTGQNHIFSDTGQTAISYYDNQTSTDPYIDYSATSAFEVADKAWAATQPLAIKTYSDVTITNNNDPNGWLYFGAVKPTDYNTPWKIRYKVYASIDGTTDSYQQSEVMIEGAKDTYYTYRTYNMISNTNYRPLYGYSLYTLKQAGVNNGYGHLIGIRFQSAYWPNSTYTNYKRTIKIEIIESTNCQITLADTMFLYTDASGTGSTNYNTRYSFDGTTQGYTGSGDRNETNHILNNFSGKTGVLGIWSAGLFMRDGNGTYQNICTDSAGAISRTVNTTKKPNPNGFEIGSQIYYSPWNTYNANSNINGSVYASYGAFDSRYSLNTTLTTNCLTPYEPVYLVGTVRTDGLYYLDTVWWTQTPTDSSKTYVLIGGCYDSTTSYCRINLFEQNNWYKYVDGKLVDYTNRLAELAATTATAYITDTTNNGIMVHPENDTTSGWSIAGAIELFKSSISYIKLWIDNNIPKIRIGKEDSKHVLIDDDSVDIVDDENVLASFGETARIGKEDQGHIIIDNDSLDIRDGQKILSSFGERDIIQYDQNGAPIFWVSQFPTTDTMGIRQAVHETIYDTIEIFRRGVKLKYHPQAETKCNFSIIIEDTTDDIISESAFNIPDFESNESNEGEALYDKSITIEVIAEKRSGGDGGTYTYEATLDFNHSYTLFYISNYSFSNTAKVRLILDYINDSDTTFYQPYYSFGTRYSYVNAGIYSFVEGYNNTANGKSTHAEGYYTTADGDYSHSEGVLSLASGEMAHAEGYSCTASGNSSHVEGDGTEASNTGAHAEGSGTIASGICSHAQNWQTIAESDYQTALGKYNITDSQNKYAIIVGNGTTGNARSNAYAITWDGDTEFALDVTASSGTLDADLYDAITALGWNINDITV